MTQLVVDSGATRATWIVLTDGIPSQQVETPGISPLHLSAVQTREILAQTLPPLPILDCIHFYGTGCGSPLQQADMRQRLSDFFTSASQITVHTDLLAAARALFGQQAGIAAILGTGSNSCYYDGTEIVHNWGGLGYVLGDEGSGAILGRRWLHAYLTHRMPLEIRKAFQYRFELSRGVIMNHVYRQPLASRYLGSFVPFIAEWRTDDFVSRLLHEHFSEFIRTNVQIYPQWRSLPLGVSGSIGFYFEKELRAATPDAITFHSIVQSPVSGLVAYHRAVQGVDKK